jgi:glycerol uptake facilitator-like aquaporin
MTPSLAQRGVAECLGTAFLLAAVVGSGIMAARLAGGNNALALLCNTLPTGAILAVLILTFAPISGAHFNPVVSIAFAIRGELPVPMAVIYIGAQVLGAILGVAAPGVLRHSVGTTADGTTGLQFFVPLVRGAFAGRSGLGPDHLHEEPRPTAEW